MTKDQIFLQTLVGCLTNIITRLSHRTITQKLFSFDNQQLENIFYFLDVTLMAFSVSYHLGGENRGPQRDKLELVGLPCSALRC